MLFNVLVISNNVLSKTSNNGKTLYSFFRGFPKGTVSQLFFSDELPCIPGYNYFRLSDTDIILGKAFKNSRGRSVAPQRFTNSNYKNSHKIKAPRNTLTLSIREGMWKNAWQSTQLERWIDSIHPNIVFFVAGDCLFAYDICNYIVRKTGSYLCTFVTDDYILPRSEESIFDRKRRLRIKSYMERCINESRLFFTISERMRKQYRNLFKKNSIVVFNKAEDYYDSTIVRKRTSSDEILFVYAGGFHYGRDEVLIVLGRALQEWNHLHDDERAVLVIYSNDSPSRQMTRNMSNNNSICFGGSLNQRQLKTALNTSDALVFVESFEEKQIEMTRLSLSTKIPEYLSIGKPILAIGPNDIGSMDYLNDVSFRISSMDSLSKGLNKFLRCPQLWDKLAKKAREKYLDYSKAERGQSFYMMLAGETK